jgi:hypothetical protein
MFDPKELLIDAMIATALLVSMIMLTDAKIQHEKVSYQYAQTK